MWFTLLFALTVKLLILACTVCDMQRELQTALTKTSELVSCDVSDHNIGMRCITTFRSTTDRIYDVGPIRL